MHPGSVGHVCWSRRGRPTCKSAASACGLGQAALVVALACSAAVFAVEWLAFAAILHVDAWGKYVTGRKRYRIGLRTARAGLPLADAAKEVRCWNSVVPRSALGQRNLI